MPSEFSIAGLEERRAKRIAARKARAKLSPEQRSAIEWIMTLSKRELVTARARFEHFPKKR